MKNNSKRPPCPDPERYQWITTHEGSFWRLKRGLHKPAKLNSTLAAHAAALAFSSKTASRILLALKPYMNGIHTGRINTRFSILLKKQFLEKGKVDYTLFKHLDFQPRYPFESLLQVYPQVIREKQKIGIRIQSSGQSGIFNKNNTLVNGFDFRAILLSGKPHDQMRPDITSAQSDVLFAEDNKTPAELWLSLPQKKIPWMLILKISGYEDNAPAIHARHYAMKVMETGR